jgi:hypothetical protein
VKLPCGRRNSANGSSLSLANHRIARCFATFAKLNLLFESTFRLVEELSNFLGGKSS